MCGVLPPEESGQSSRYTVLRRHPELYAPSNPSIDGCITSSTGNLNLFSAAAFNRLVQLVILPFPGMHVRGPVCWHLQASQQAAGAVGASWGAPRGPPSELPEMATNLERRSTSSTLSAASSGSLGAASAHGYPLRVRSNSGSVSGGTISKRLSKKGDGPGVVRALLHGSSARVPLPWLLVRLSPGNRKLCKGCKAN